VLACLVAMTRRSMLNRGLGYYLPKLEHGGGKKCPNFFAIDEMIF